MADIKLERLLGRIDAWAAGRGLDTILAEGERPQPTVLPPDPVLTLDLGRQGIRTIVWATGYRPDYSWLEVPVLDRKGRLHHDGGIVAAPGLYVLGLPFMRRRKSSFIDGVGEDAGDLARHIKASLARAA